MRYQTALVLSTIAVGQAVASDARHAHFHARRHAEEKRNAAEVDWKRVAGDVYGLNQKDWDTLVNWKTVNYGGSSSSTAAAAAAYTPAPTAASPSPTADKPSSSSEYKPAQTSSTSSPSSSSGTTATDLLTGLAQFAHLGIFGGSGDNAKSASSDKLWIGDDGKYKATFVNDGDKDCAVIGWNSKGMWINANKPQIYVHLAAGEQTTVSIPYGLSGGFGVAFSDSTLMDGLLNESILEFTAKENENGCFDISREINMNGIVLTAQGSKCTSGLLDGKLACTFVCTSGTKCGAGGGDYNIALGAETQGPCMIGKDPYTGDASGGCQMGDGEHIKVTIHGSRSWPS